MNRKTFCSAAALAAALCLAAPARSQSASQPSDVAPQGAAAVRLWHGAARDAIARQKPNQQAALRLLAYLAWAQHRAASAFAAPGSMPPDAAWETLFHRTAAATLSGLMLAQAEAFRRLADAQPAAATDAPFDRARAIADEAAAAALARAAADGFDAPWTGSLPADESAWRSQLEPARAPHLPMLGRMQPFFIPSGSALRPPAPPAVHSAAFAQALGEVRSRSGAAQPAAVARARQWEMVTGSLVAGFWDETAARLSAQQGLSGPQTARVFAATLGATMDANIACHDAKYAYWVPRPSQVDPALKPLVGLPNHPSYPSNHACDSGAAAQVLGAFFPHERDTLRAMAEDAADSRIDAGIHYRFDAEAGLAIGRAAAQAALRALQPETLAQGPVR